MVDAAFRVINPGTTGFHIFRVEVRIAFFNTLYKKWIFNLIASL